MVTKHNHSTKPNYKRVHGDKYEYYNPAIPGCAECRAAADAKNKQLKEAAQDNFIKRQH